MTSQTAPKTTGAKAALAAAAQKTADAGAALTAAEDAIPAAKQALVAAEQALVDVLSNASGESPNRAEMGKARTAVEKCRSDLEWADVQHRAAEQRYFAAVENEAVAHRAAIAEEYIAEHERWTGPDNREPILRAQIESGIAELITVLADRNALHGRLMQEVENFPQEERLQLPAAGRGLSSGARPAWYAPLALTVRDEEIKQAIEAGLANGHDALQQRERAVRVD
jgi:hypothetical protein